MRITMNKGESPMTEDSSTERYFEDTPEMPWSNLAMFMSCVGRVGCELHKGNKFIHLSGATGTGKTRFGRSLADYLQCPYVDLKTIFKNGTGIIYSDSAFSELVKDSQALVVDDYQLVDDIHELVSEFLEQIVARNITLVVATRYPPVLTIFGLIKSGMTHYLELKFLDVSDPPSLMRINAKETVVT